MGLAMKSEIGQKDNHQLDDLYLVIMLFYCMRSLTIILLVSVINEFIHGLSQIANHFGIIFHVLVHFTNDLIIFIIYFGFP